MHSCHDFLHRREMVTIEEIFEELHRHLCIGLRVESISFLYEFRLYLRIILDDTVMDDDESPRLGNMRMTILLGHTTVGRPASMTDTCMITRESI